MGLIDLFINGSSTISVMSDKLESIFKEIESMRNFSVVKYGMIWNEKDKCFVIGELKNKVVVKDV
jgi:hypothetical protein